MLTADFKEVARKENLKKNWKICFKGGGGGGGVQAYHFGKMNFVLRVGG